MYNLVCIHIENYQTYSHRSGCTGLDFHLHIRQILKIYKEKSKLIKTITNE